MSNFTNSQNPQIEKNPQIEVEINSKNEENKGINGKVNKILPIPRKALILSLVLVSIFTLCSFGGLIYLQNSSKLTSNSNSNNSSNSQKNLSNSEQKSIKSKDYITEMWKNSSPENLKKLENEQKTDLTKLTQLDLKKYPKPYLLVDGSLFDQNGQNVIETEIKNTKIFSDYSTVGMQSIYYKTPPLFDAVITGDKFYQLMGISTIMIVDLQNGKIEWSDTGFESEFANSIGGKIYLSKKSENERNCNAGSDSCMIFEFDPITKKFQEIYNTDKLQMLGAGPCGNTYFQVEFVDENYVYLGYDCADRYVVKYDKSGKFVDSYSLDFPGCYECRAEIGYGYTIYKWSKDPKLVEMEQNKLWEKFPRKDENSNLSKEKILQEDIKRGELVEKEQLKLTDKYRTIYKKADQNLDCFNEKNKYKCQVCPSSSNYVEGVKDKDYQEKMSQIQNLRKEALITGQEFVCLDRNLEEKFRDIGQIEFQKLFPYNVWQSKMRQFNKNLFEPKDYPKGGVCGDFVWNWEVYEYDNSNLFVKIFNPKIKTDKLGQPMENGQWASNSTKISCVE